MSVVAIEACDCMDFDPTDPDDSLCIECVCGHVDEEHEPGPVFRPCAIGQTRRTD